MDRDNRWDRIKKAMMQWFTEQVKVFDSPEALVEESQDGAWMMSL